MLLDEWSEEELALARAIGAGASSGNARHKGGLDEGPRSGKQANVRGYLDLESGAEGEAADRAEADFLGDDWLDDAFERRSLSGSSELDPPRGGSESGRDGPEPGDGEETGYPEEAEEAEAANEAGAGRIASEDDQAQCEVSLDLRPAGGDGLLLTVMLGEQKARAWVDAHAWCEWIAPKLTVQRPQQIPPDLLPLLGQWTLLALQRRAEQAGLPAPRFLGAEAGSVPRSSAPTLTLRRPDAAIELRLLEWPAAWVATMAGSMAAPLPPLELPAVPVALAAGWVRLSRRQLRELQPGDGVVLERAARVELGHAWLVAGRTLGNVRFDDGIWRIEDTVDEETMMDAPDAVELEGEGLTDDSIVLTAVAEVARLPMPLDVLQGLHRGQVLELAHASHGRVTLTVSGRQVARGALLRVGDKLVMRIE